MRSTERWRESSRLDKMQDAAEGAKRYRRHCTRGWEVDWMLHRTLPLLRVTKLYRGLWTFERMLHGMQHTTGLWELNKALIPAWDAGRMLDIGQDVGLCTGRRRLHRTLDRTLDRTHPVQCTTIQGPVNHCSDTHCVEH